MARDRVRLGGGGRGPLPLAHPARAPRLDAAARLRDTSAVPAFGLDRVRITARRQRFATTWLWREWCFLRVVGARFRARLLLLALILVVGALLFIRFEPEKAHSLARAMFFTWCLAFGEFPEEFPAHPVLRGAFFLTPVLGLTIIIESIVDFALTLRDRRRSEHSWCATMAHSLSDHIVLVGLGRLGFRTYRMLRKLNEPVVVIERKPDAEFLEDVRHDGVPLLIGDARRDASLIEANIARARSIILATNDDLANLEIALDARRYNPNVRVVLRMFDQHMADKVRGGFNIHIAMSQAAISAPTFAMAAIEPSIVATTVVGDRLLVTQRWVARQDNPICDKTVGELLETHRFSVLELRRGEETQLFPPPRTTIRAGDQLVVQGTFEALALLTRGGRLTDWPPAAAVAAAARFSG